MAKKNFEEINTGNLFAEQIESAVSETIEEPIPRQKQGELPTEEIVQMAREQGKTQGRKGCKAHRFNMAFSPKAYDFIVCMARVRAALMKIKRFIRKPLNLGTACKRKGA